MRSQTHPKMIAGDFVTRATSGEDAVKEMLPECETLLAQDLGQLLDNIIVASRTVIDGKSSWT